jgi:hypothetical protein
LNLPFKSLPKRIQSRSMIRKSLWRILQVLSMRVFQGAYARLMRKIPRIPLKDWNIPFTRLWRTCQKPRAKLHGTTQCIYHRQSPPNFRNQTYHLHLQHHHLSMPTQTMIKDTNKCTQHPVHPQAPTSTAKPPIESPLAKPAQIWPHHRRLLPCVEFRRQRPPPEPPDQHLPLRFTGPSFFSKGVLEQIHRRKAKMQNYFNLKDKCRVKGTKLIGVFLQS